MGEAILEIRFFTNLSQEVGQYNERISEELVAPEKSEARVLPILPPLTW